MVFSQAIIALPSFLYLLTTRQSYVKVIGIRKLSFINFVLLILFSYTIQQVITFINALSRVYTKGVIQDTALGIATENPFWLTLILMAIVPAILEESIYRGIFYQEYRKVNPFQAIFLSALLFGLMHGNFNQFSYAFVMGFIFALLIEATDSILSTMLVHFCFNGSSVIILYYLPKLLERSNIEMENVMTNQIELTMAEVFRYYGPRALIFGMVSAMIYYQIAKNCNRWDHIKEIFLNHQREKNQKSTGRLMTWPLVLGIGFLVIIMIGREFM